MAVKRRNVWLSDETWAKLAKIAADGKVSRSQVIADLARIVSKTRETMADRTWPPNAARDPGPEADVSEPTPDKVWRRSHAQPSTVPEALYAPRITSHVPRDPTFRPAPKPGKR